MNDNKTVEINDPLMAYRPASATLMLARDIIHLYSQ